MESSIGRFSFAGKCTIVNWKLSGASSIPFIALRQGELRRIRDVGCLIRVRGSRLVHTTIFLSAVVNKFSLGKAFGSKRSPLEWLFLSGQQP